MSSNSANITPIFTNAGNMFPIHVAAANTASDGSGTLATLLTAATDGTRVDAIKITNAQTTAAASSAMICRVFVTDAFGNDPRIVAEIGLAAATRSNTIVGANNTITFSPALVLKAGQQIKVCQSVYAGAQDQTSWIAFAGNF